MAWREEEEEEAGGCLWLLLLVRPSSVDGWRRRSWEEGRVRAERLSSRAARCEGGRGGGGEVSSEEQNTSESRVYCLAIQERG